MRPIDEDKSRVTGLIAAPFTALNGDLSLNLPMVDRQARALAERGVSGAFVCGTTGEGFSFTTAERLQIAEGWLAVAPQTLRVIVHVGHNSLAESRTLAAHAQQNKAYAIATLAPTFFRPARVEHLVDYCAQIAESAPELPFYYYHMPAMTGVEFSMHDFLKLGRDRIPNLAGIKFTHENLMEFSRCLDFEKGRFNMLFGRDEMLLGALAMGARGAVGSTYNYMAPVYVRMIELFHRGELEAARRVQCLAIRIIEVMSRRGGLAAGKAMMKMIGLDCGPVRPPLRNLTPEAEEALRVELEQLGFPNVLKSAQQSLPNNA